MPEASYLATKASVAPAGAAAADPAAKAMPPVNWPPRMTLPAASTATAAARSLAPAVPARSLTQARVPSGLYLARKASWAPAAVRLTAAAPAGLKLTVPPKAPAR